MWMAQLAEDRKLREKNENETQENGFRYSWWVARFSLRQLTNFPRHLVHGWWIKRSYLVDIWWAFSQHARFDLRRKMTSRMKHIFRLEETKGK